MPKFWEPSLTSQFRVCPIPFHLDPYGGRVYNCNYCFARDFITFHRRKSGFPFTYLEWVDPAKFEAWCKKVSKLPHFNYSKGEQVAFKERIPLKIGATSDPFPPIEKELKVTYSVLKTLDKYDYPTEIQTKNPAILLSYANDFIRSGWTYDPHKPNWIVAVTLISTDDNFLKVAEPNAPSANERLDAIRGLTALGIPVMVKVQPAIYPKIMDDLPDLIKAIARAGVWAFNIQALKIRIAMPKPEQALLKRISDFVGIDLRDYYRGESQKLDKSYYNLCKSTKMKYITLAQKLAREHDLKFFVADNHMGRVGDGSECCGTQALHNYQIFGNNERTRFFGEMPPYCSKYIGKCKVNFCRTSFGHATMDEVAGIPECQRSLCDYG